MWNNGKYETRRLELAKLYAGLTDNPEEEHRRVPGKRKELREFTTKNTKAYSTYRLSIEKALAASDGIQLSEIALIEKK